MNRRCFLVSAAAVPLAARSALVAETLPASSAVTNKLRGGAHNTEPMMSRYQLTLNRVLHGTSPSYTPEFLLEDIHATPGRRFTNYSGDVSGRWIGALSAASSTYGQSFPSLDDVVHRVLKLQHAEGYFGKSFNFDHPEDDDLALLWGNGRLLVGLLEYDTLKHDPAVLLSAKKLGEFLLRIAPAFNSTQMAEKFGAEHFASGYICWTQQTEGLAALFAATGDLRFRDLCAAISERAERIPADHVHGYLCSLRGTLALYHLTDDKVYLNRVVAAWQGIMDSGDVLVTGGVPEAWSPKKLRTEGCAECDWLRLNLALWHATGDTKYLNLAEHVLFNEFSMNQFSTGDFGHSMLNELGTPGIVYVRAWWCCTLHGLRAFPDIHRSVFRTAGEDVFYDLPIEGHLETATFSARATSQLALDGTVRIVLEKAAEGHTLTVRKPSWAHGIEITLNGRTIDNLTLASLKPRDLIKIKYTMSIDEHRAGDSHHLASRKAFFYGPWLLGAPSEPNPGYFNEMQQENILIANSARPAPEESESPFRVPIASSSISYLPAEFPVQPSHVNLRAVAEQTGSLPTQWEMAFIVRESS